MGNHESRTSQVGNILAPSKGQTQTQQVSAQTQQVSAQTQQVSAQKNKDSSEWGEQDKKKPVTFQNLKLREFEAGVCVIR